MVDPKPFVVIDASVILKWFFHEKDREKALTLRTQLLNQEIKVGMPIHCLIEIANIVGIKQPKYALAIISEIKMAQIEEYRIDIESAGQAFKIMHTFSKISFYDAVYHAVALRHNGIFVTADEEYYQKTKSLGNIVLLKNYI